MMERPKSDVGATSGLAGALAQALQDRARTLHGQYFIKLCNSIMKNQNLITQ